MVVKSAYAAAKAWQIQHQSPNASTSLTNSHTGRVEEESRSLQVYNVDESIQSHACLASGSNPEPALDLQLSSWAFEGHTSPSLIAMKAGQYLTCIGCYKLMVQSGAVSIYGARLPAGPSKYHVYVPSIDALPRVTCLTKSASIRLADAGQSLINLDKMSPLFGRIWGTDAARTYTFLQQSSHDIFRRTLRPLETPSDALLESILHRATGHTKQVLICGPKASGKSTFAKTLLNYAVTAKSHDTIAKGFIEASTPWATVYYLDLDPGQPEFTPSGFLSLVKVQSPVLGPSFSHAWPEPCLGLGLVKCHTIAATSPRDDPDYYYACVEDLFNEHRKINPDSLLIVNCPGWILGLGFEITMHILQTSMPSDVVWTGNGSMVDVARSIERAAGRSKFHAPALQYSPGTARTPTQLRAMQSLSYFHSTCNSENRQTWDAEPLLNVRSEAKKLKVKFDAASMQLLGIMSLAEQPAEEFLWAVLDRSVVALAFVDDLGISNSLRDSTTFTSVQHLPYWSGKDAHAGLIPILAKSRSVGLALVRSIDVESHTLDLVTPAASAIQRAIERATSSSLILIRGNFDTPGWANTEQKFFSDCRSRQDTSTPICNLQSRLVARKLNVDELPAIYDEITSDEEEQDYIKKIEDGQGVGSRWRGVKGRPWP